MPVSYIRPAGGLPSTAKALLIPENIRAGVHIQGGGVDVTGNALTAVAALAVGDVSTGWDNARSVIPKIPTNAAWLKQDGTSLVAQKAFACKVLGAPKTNGPYSDSCGVRILNQNGTVLYNNVATSFNWTVSAFAVEKNDIIKIQIYRPSDTWSCFAFVALFVDA